LKSGVRIAAITTGPISKRSDGRSLLVCIIGNSKGVEGVLSSNVEVDGIDSTQKIIEMLDGSRFMEQVRVVAFNGIALAGLNIVDINKVCKRLHVKAVVITRHKPRISLLERSIRSLRSKGIDIADRLELLRSQSKSMRIAGFYVQSYPDQKSTAGFVAVAAGLLRLSHLISRGVATGESRGRI